MGTQIDATSHCVDHIGYVLKLTVFTQFVAILSRAWVSWALILERSPEFRSRLVPGIPEKVVTNCWDEISCKAAGLSEQDQ